MKTVLIPRCALEQLLFFFTKYIAIITCKKSAKLIDKQREFASQQQVLTDQKQVFIKTQEKLTEHISKNNNPLLTVYNRIK
ncbi:hypothetical protein [Flavobacterium sp. LAR06]|uniref:hypothetical protein n=1 Tax=Flavobacterium sp. LAR06 TaxID=3064897 RepID=UPI0035C1A5CC